ncbi:hypothetical protein GOP47_0001742 [Adiantum capillus-veneris]|uniref:Uncharacterized protein n=1 Tax=Adiantum capillus-veneris TaxID=13818 RepID=A0A9D4ZNJ9_ADICA|nr:hypothetical protein GOP47_0001742 [Adiantum capillus-veneris]
MNATMEFGWCKLKVVIQLYVTHASLRNSKSAILVKTRWPDYSLCSSTNPNPNPNPYLDYPAEKALSKNVGDYQFDPYSAQSELNPNGSFVFVFRKRYICLY